MKPLGTYLVQKKILTAQKVEDALQNQSILGGKLGTNLVELGYIPLDVLEMHLGKYFGILPVDHNEFDQINANLLQSIPRRLIEKYKFLPLKRQENVLRIATMNPKDRTMLEELSGVFGIKIEPRVASEIRILFYLGQLCNMPSDIRIRSLFFHYRKSYASGRNLPPPKIEEGKRDLLQKGFRPLEKGEELTNEGFEEFLLEQTITRQKTGSVATPQAPPPPPAQVPDAPPVAPTKETLLTMEDLNRLLNTIQERDQVGDLSTRFAAQFVRSFVIFVVNSGLVTGWNARGRNLSKDTLRGLVVPLVAESVFQTISQGTTHFYGRLSSQDINQRILSTLGLEADQEVLIIPVYLKKRLVNILLAENGKAPLPQPNLNALIDLSRWLSKAYQHLIMVRKKVFKGSMKKG